MRWSLRDEVSLVVRYAPLGLLAGFVAEGAMSLTGHAALVAPVQLGLAVLVVGSWARLALWRGGAGWEAALLASGGGLLGVSAFSGQFLLVAGLAPLPWVGLRPLRFAGRAALAVLHTGSCLAIAHLYFVPNPEFVLPFLSALLGLFLLLWHHVETAEGRRRAVRVLGCVAGGMAASGVLLLLGLFAGNTLLSLAVTIPPALFVPRLVRYSRRSMKTGATKGEAA
ncbi:MAG TPA: hypothetical protein VM241_06705 [Candidatus Thermoplasmatota archaeon]|nr:hypothetical protein [Candidatus Thermoplasmatota archaeon]